VVVTTLKIEFIDSLSRVAADTWNAITGTDYPFTRHEFLHALERSGAVGESSGWITSHILVWREQELIAVMPLYKKLHSYGEYVFDWSWANAYQRYGYNYYPKLLCAIPFTPATGPRLCVKAGADSEVNRVEIAAAIINKLQQKICGVASSLHILFPGATEGAEFAALGLSERSGVQYHWHNAGFTDFDSFLATFNSRKRKSLRRERDRVAAQGIVLTQNAAVTEDI
jgi:predicted N-acyltransferase